MRKKECNVVGCKQCKMIYSLIKKEWMDELKKCSTEMFVIDYAYIAYAY